MQGILFTNRYLIKKQCHKHTCCTLQKQILNQILNVYVYVHAQQGERACPHLKHVTVQPAKASF